MTGVASYFISGSFLAAGIVNVLPAIGALSDSRLLSLYGVDVLSNDMSLLLRHRALLFLIVGVLLVSAAFIHSLRTIAGAAGLVSMVSFVVLAWSIGDVNPYLQRIVTIDIGLSILLVTALAMHQYSG